MRVTKQALNYLLRDLERMGYVELHPDPSDRRARLIALTDRGRSLVPVIRGAVADAQREWAAELGKERFAELIELLVELNEIVAAEGGLSARRGEADVHVVLVVRVRDHDPGRARAARSSSRRRSSARRRRRSGRARSCASAAVDLVGATSAPGASPSSRG